MAQRVNVVLVDDIDGSDAAETVTFGLDGVQYEIDLSDGHADELRAALALYIGHGRRAGGRGPSPAPPPAARAPASAARRTAGPPPPAGPVVRRPPRSGPGPGRTAGTSPSGDGFPQRCARRTPPRTDAPGPPRQVTSPSRAGPAVSS